MARNKITVYDESTPHVYNAVVDSSLIMTRNTLHQFEFEVLNMGAADYDIIADNALITYEEYDSDASDYYEVFRGYVRNAEKTSFKRAKVRASSSGVKLLDKNWENREDGRYVNQATDDIVADVASGTMDVGTNDITDVITIEFGLQNKLRSIAQLAGVHGGEWWTDTGPTLNDRINVSESRFGTSSVATFEVGKSARLASDNKDSERIYNCITVLGQGDGINQVSAKSYGFCTDIKQLTADLSATGNEFFVDTSTSMAAENGIVYINNEKIKYRYRTGLRCYQLTVWDEDSSSWTARNRDNGSYYHNSTMKVWYAGTTANEYSKNNPATGSSVKTYGVREYTHYDRSILRLIGGEGTLDDDIDPFETAGKVAYILYNRYKEPLRTIKFTKSNYRLDGLQVGQIVTIVDAQQSLNADFKIQKIEYIKKKGIPKITITCNSLLYDFYTTIDELQKDMDTSGIYGQGATNIYQNSRAENVDTDHPLYFRFYLSDEVVAVNKVKLSVRMKNYRADSLSVTSTPKFETLPFVWEANAPDFLEGDFSEILMLQDVIPYDRTYLRDISMNYTNGFARNLNETKGGYFIYTDDSTVATFANVDHFVKTINTGTGTITNYFNVGSADNFMSSEGYFGTDQVVTDLSWSTSSAITGITETKNDAIYDLDGEYSSVYHHGTKFTITEPIFINAYAPDVIGDFDRIVFTGSVKNGGDASKSIIIRLKRNGITFKTFTDTLSSAGIFPFSYETTNDWRGDDIRIEISGLDVNQSDFPNLSNLVFNITTFVKSTDSLNYGIVENTSEFTPPGTIDISIYKEGDSPTVVGTYSSDQTGIELSDSILFEKDNTYVIEITPHADTYNGRMRIEADLYNQVYIESR